MSNKQSQGKNDGATDADRNSEQNGSQAKDNSTVKNETQAKQDTGGGSSKTHGRGQTPSGKSGSPTKGHH